MSHYGGGAGDDAPPGYSGPPRQAAPQYGAPQYPAPPAQPYGQQYPATPVGPAQPYNERSRQHAGATGRNDRQLPDGTWVDYKGEPLRTNFVTRADGTIVSEKFEVELNQMYARCVTMGDVFRIWNEHGVMNGINLSTGLARLGRAVARDRSLVNRIRDSYEFRDMCKLLRSKLCDNPDWTGARQLATAAHAFAKLNPANARGQDTRNEVAAMATVGRAATAKIREFNTQELSNTAWAYATAHHAEPALFAAIGSVVVMKAPQFKAQEISNTLWAFAKMEIGDCDEVFASLADAAMRLACNNPQAYNPQNVSNALWAFAKSNRRHPQLYAALGPVGARIARNFSMQALANVAWAFAQNEEKCPELFDALGDFAAEHVLDFSPTALADTTWGFVQCGSPNPRLLDRVGDLLYRRARSLDFTPASLAKLAQAFQRADQMSAQFNLEQKHIDGLLTGAHAFVTGPKNLRTKDGTDLLKAYAELRMSRHGEAHHRRFAEVFYALDQALGRNVRDFHPNDLALAATSFASINCDAPRFFRDVLRNADHCFADHRNAVLKFEAASDVLRACAVLGWVDDQAMARLGQVCADRMHDASEDALVDAVEALAKVGGFHSSSLFKAVAVSGRSFQPKTAERLLDAFALAGAWHDDFLGSLTEHADAAKLFRVAAAAERPSLLPPGVTPEPLQDAEGRADVVKRVVAELGEWGWPCATVGGADARNGEVVCLLDDRIVRDVGGKRERPDGLALLHARLALRAGRRLEFVSKEALDEARSNDAARAKLLARLRGEDHTVPFNENEAPAAKKAARSFEAPAVAPAVAPAPEPTAMEAEPTAAPAPAAEAVAAEPAPAPAAAEAEPAAAAEFDEAAATKQCKKMKVTELRAALEAAGAETKGLKAALVERLVEVKRAAASNAMDL